MYSQVEREIDVWSVWDEAVQAIADEGLRRHVQWSKWSRHQMYLHESYDASSRAPSRLHRQALQDRKYSCCKRLDSTIKRELAVNKDFGFVRSAK